MEVGRGFDYYWNEIESYSNKKGDILWINFNEDVAKSIGLGKIMINKKFSLNHIFGREDREKYLLYAFKNNNLAF